VFGSTEVLRERQPGGGGAGHMEGRGGLCAGLVVRPLLVRSGLNSGVKIEFDVEFAPACAERIFESQRTVPSRETRKVRDD